MSHYLSIDYGQHNLGFAIASDVLATPVGILKYQDHLHALTHLKSLIEKYHITHLVIGLPEGPVASSVRAFGSLLTKEFSLPVIFHPETLSTQEAKKSLLATGNRRKRSQDHTYAACLILEDYLEFHSRS